MVNEDTLMVRLNKLKENLVNMAAFRNLLVHDYVRIDRGMVYKIITENLDDFRYFMKEIVRCFF